MNSLIRRLLSSLVCQCLCIGFLCSHNLSAVFAQDSPPVNSTEKPPLLPFRLGLVGGIARHFPLTALDGLAGLPPFSAPLQEYNNFTPEIGVEAIYRILPNLELGLRGAYARTTFEAAINERLPVSVWNPMLGMRVPILAVIRNIFEADVAMLSAMPLIRLYLGDIFFIGAGARFDVPFQTTFRYRSTIVEPQNIGFVVTPQRTLDTVFRNALASTPLSFAPVLSFGAAFPIGNTRIIPELQVQPLFQPFRSITPERAALPLPTLRFNVSIVLGFTEAKSSHKTADTTQKTADTTQNAVKDSANSVTAALRQTTSVIPNLLSSKSLPTNLTSRKTSDTSSTQLTNDTLGQRSAAAPLQTIMRRDTVFERDTTIRITAWNQPDTVRLLRNDIRRAIVNGTEQTSITESFQHDIPKPKPFLVGVLNVRFIPTLSAPKTAESQQTSRLVEKSVVVRTWIATPQSTSGTGYDEVLDTVAAVRMPLIRFLPKISSEAGTNVQSIMITPQTRQNAPFTEVRFIGTKPIDWDAQTMIFPDILPNYQSWLQKHSAVQGQEETGFAKQRQTMIPIPTDTLFAWMYLNDTETQEYSSDTVNITVERSERMEIPPYTRTTIVAKGQNRWTIAHLPVIRQEDSLKTAYTLTKEARLLKQHLQKVLLKPGGKPVFKNASVYAALPNTAPRLNVDEVENIIRLLRSIAESFKAQAYFLTILPQTASSKMVSPKKNDTFPLTDAYIRVLIEE